MDIEQRVRQLEDREAIRELTARYCHAVVDGDAERIVSLFCEDGRFVSHTFTAEGSAALGEMYAGGVGARTHKPFVQNHVIEFDNEVSATGRCSVEIRVWQDGAAYTQAGHYHDRYRKVGGRWLFAERDYRRYHNAPWASGWSKP